MVSITLPMWLMIPVAIWLVIDVVTNVLDWIVKYLHYRIEKECEV